MRRDLRQWWVLPTFEERPLRSKDDDRYTPHHVGLYLDRCLPLPYDPAARDDYAPKTKEELVKQKAHRMAAYTSAVKSLSVRPESAAVRTYRACFKRWKEALAPKSLPPTVRVIELETTSRVLLHPSANQSITDGAVLMHHTYGAPYLPGSGLKGLARAQARRAGHPREVIRALFGNDREAEPGEPSEENPDQAALVRFLDALWIPELPKDAPADWSPLEQDVVTPHHSDYYTGDQPPADWQQPVPTQRLTVSPGARFCVILEGCPAPADQLEDWLNLAEELLVDAVQALGFGAYTRAGFGRMRAVNDEVAQRAETRRAAEQAAEKSQAEAEEAARRTEAEAEEAARRAKAEAEEAARVAVLPWESVFVARDPGSGDLTFTLKSRGQKKLTLRGELGRALLQSAPAVLVERLIKRRSLDCLAQLDDHRGSLRVVGLK